MIILAIETSCDDTCCSILEIKNNKLKLLSNIVSSQVKLHAKYGGVYPTLAKREHQKNLPIVLKRALKKIDYLKIDLIAVTIGPGLDPCLWVGINFAKDLAKSWKIPIIGTNHIEGHIIANWLAPIGENYKSQIINYKNLFPALCLIVSGGHTQLILMKSFGKYKIIGETRDDAAGECFDKTARILGLSYPGGPAIAEQAWQWKSAQKIKLAKRRKESKTFFEQTLNSKFNIKLPRPMIYQKNYDFSFSGLKTAVLYEVKKKKRKSKKYIQAMAAEIQQAIIDVLIRKTIKAAKEYKVKSIILGGGVIANNELRRQFQEKIKKEIPQTNLYFPNIKLCTDNALMIAVTAYFHWIKKKNQKFFTASQKIKADANLRI